MSRPNAITRRTADTLQAVVVADGGPGQALPAPVPIASQPSSAVASDVTVDRYDHAAAAAYLMRHHGTTALLILDGDRSNPPIGIITETDLIQAVADGKDLNTIRVQELMSQYDPAGSAPMRQD